MDAVFSELVPDYLQIKDQYYGFRKIGWVLVYGV